LPQTLPNFGSGRSVADARKGARIPRERREAPNPHYLPGAGEGSSDLATSFHPSGDASPGALDAAADRSFIAALAVSKARGGLPAPGQGQLPPSEV